MLARSTLETFSPHLGETFWIEVDPAHTLETILVAAVGLGEAARPPDARQATRRRPFSLVFRGPCDAVLPQRIYRLRHDSIGTFNLFLVPIGPDDAGMRYEAVFA
jgi:hypothetical protein